MFPRKYLGSTKWSQGLVHAHPVPCRCLECLDKDLPNVIANPLVEDGTQKVAELLWQDRAVCDGVSFLNEGAAVFVNTLHHWDKLHPISVNLITDEVVNFQGMIAIDPVHGGQDIELHLMFLQQPDAAHHLVECRLTPFVHPVCVMQLPGAVDADADEEVVFFEELAPTIVKQCAIGLHGVQKSHSRPGVFLFQFHPL